MDLGALRAAVSGYIGGFPSMSHEAMPAAFERMGLPNPREGTKAQRAQRCVESLRDEQRQPVAQRIFVEDRPAASTRFMIEELLWEDWPGVLALSKRVRRELADAIDIDLFRDHFDRLMVLLDRLWFSTMTLRRRPSPPWPGDVNDGRKLVSDRRLSLEHPWGWSVVVDAVLGREFGRFPRSFIGAHT